MFTNLALQNFKSWRSIEGMRLAPITGLFGTNSSGKTSILQLLLLLRQTVESADRAAVLDLGTDRGLVQLGSFRDLVFNHATTEDVSLELGWTLPSPLQIADPASSSRVLFRAERMCFSTRVGMNGDEKLAVREMSYHLDGNHFAMRQKEGTEGHYELVAEAGRFAFARQRGRVWDLPAPTKCYGFPDQTFAYFQNAGFLADLQLEFEECTRRIYYLAPLRDFPQRHYVWAGSEPSDMGRRVERAVDALLASRDRGPYISRGRGRGRRKQTLEERVAHWLEELGLIDSFTVRSIKGGSNLYEVRVRKTPHAAEVLITDVGFGVSQVLPVIVLCYYVPEGSTVLLEQPELHLHPRVQAALADVFVDVAKNRNVQVIFESHSEHLLRRLQRRIADETIARSDAALYFCDVEDGESRLSELRLDDYGNVTNWPKDFFGDDFGEIAAIAEAALKRQGATAP